MKFNLIKTIGDRANPWVFKTFMNLWKPFRGVGIKVTDISDDFRYVRVKLKKKWNNQNYVGTQYGGSIYSMTDPFYMLMLLKNLGRDYYVWDKGALIDFVSPGKTDLIAEFKFDETLLNKIKTETASGNKYVFDLPVEIYDLNKNLVATVTKKMYTRKKQH